MPIVTFAVRIQNFAKILVSGATGSSVSGSVSLADFSEIICEVKHPSEAEAENEFLVSSLFPRA